LDRVITNRCPREADAFLSPITEIIYENPSAIRLTKRYNIELFTLEAEPGETPKPIDGLPMAWLTVAEMDTHEPVTSTARHIAHRVKESKGS
jgi:hypothetical protein